MSHAASSGTAGTVVGSPDKLRPKDFALRRVPAATVEERRLREEGMARALKVGAAPYRDAEGKARYVLFKEANNAPVEPWRRDPRAKRGYRRTQDLRKAAGQLVGQPGDQVEIAKRLGVLHYEEGSDIEGAAARGLYDAIWSREHVYHSFTVPRRYSLHLMDTGRVAAVAEEEGRKLQAEDPKASGGFWVRDRKNLGLIYVVPNADPEAEAEEELIFGGEGDDILIGQADAAVEPKPVELERPEAQPAAEAASTAEDGTPPKLSYPDIPLPTLEPTWEVPKGEGRPLPAINMEQDRIRNIVAGKPAHFEIADSSTANGDEPEYATHSYGYWAVWIYQDIIEYEAKRQGVDPDLVRAMVYVENAQGWYGHLFEAFRVAKTIFPMNINPKTWGRLVGVYGDFYDPIVNIRAGVALIRRLQERIANPTVAKVASPFKFTGRELVSDYGARVAQVYAARAWEREPIPDVYPEMDKPPDWAPEVSGYRRRREELKKQLKEEQTPRHILDEPFWTDASP